MLCSKPIQLSSPRELCQVAFHVSKWPNPPNPWKNTCCMLWCLPTPHMAVFRPFGVSWVNRSWCWTPDVLSVGYCKGIEITFANWDVLFEPRSPEEALWNSSNLRSIWSHGTWSFVFVAFPEQRLPYGLTCWYIAVGIGVKLRLCELAAKDWRRKIPTVESNESFMWPKRMAGGFHNCSW